MADKDVKISLGYRYDDREARELVKDLDAIESNVKQAARANNVYADSQREIARITDSTTDAIRRQTLTLEARNDEFDKVSQQVGLAGDVQSNLGALSGLAGAAGLGGVAGGISVVGEIAVLAEELPRLKTALAGMPQTIAAAASALGTNTAGLIGALGLTAIAVVAATVVFKELEERAQEAVNAVQASVDAVRQAEQLVAAGATSAEVQQRIDEINQLREAEAKTLAITQQAFEQYLAADPFARFGKGAEEFRNQIEQSQNSLATYDEQIDQLSKRLEAGQFATEQAAEVTQQATQQETALTEARETTTQATQQAVQAESILQQQKDRIAERNAALAQTQERENNEAQRAAEEYANIQRELSESRQDALTDYRRDLEDLQRTISQDFADALFDASLDASRSFEDSIAAGDFLGLAQIRRDAERQQQDLVRDSQRQYRREEEELRLAYNRRLEDVALAARRELDIYQQKFGAIESIITSSLDRIVASAGARMALNIDPSRASSFRTNVSSGSRVLARMG